MVQNSMASSQFLLSSPEDVAPHKPRPLNGLIAQFGAFSRSRGPEQYSSGSVAEQESCNSFTQHQVTAIKWWKTSKGRHYEYSQKTQMMLFFAKLGHLNQLPKVHEITGSGIQPKHLVRNTGCAS